MSIVTKVAYLSNCTESLNIIVRLIDVVQEVEQQTDCCMHDKGQIPLRYPAWLQTGPNLVADLQ